ncbi:MAG TPA: 4-hydroxy-tetrahydrodipicolinate synthase [Opitutae bacterium]|nr:4-hydroxy-tetrahydrodipicolinate synthase [Opitutaceae bacterium]HCR29847.1 4-hydroxy-tetrahydrodipicolinate synthase [Opitutae bacterium]
MINTRFTGSITAMATPFDADGSLSVPSLKAFVNRQIEGGINGLLPMGTTGESPTLNHEEHGEVVEIVVNEADGRVPVIAGAGSNSTREAIAMTRHADQAGADGTLHVTGYYNKPTQEGIFQHFSAIAQETDKPIVLYSIPGRCIVDISLATVEQLVARHPNIRHIKESGGQVSRVDELKQTLGDDITVLSGDDGLTLPFIASGAEGVISVASNLFPTEITELVKSALSGDLKTASDFHRSLYPLFRDLFIEPSPVPVKACLKKLGFFPTDRVRLPLCEMGQDNLAVVLDSLQQVRENLKTADTVPAT